MGLLNFEEIVNGPAPGAAPLPTPAAPPSPAGTAADGSPVAQQSAQQPAPDFQISVPPAPQSTPAPAEQPPAAETPPAGSQPTAEQASGSNLIDFEAIVGGQPGSSDAATAQQPADDTYTMSMMPFSQTKSKDEGHDAALREALRMGLTPQALPAYLAKRGFRLAIPHGLQDLIDANWRGMTDNYAPGAEGKAQRQADGVTVALAMTPGSPAINPSREGLGGLNMLKPKHQAAYDAVQAAERLNMSMSKVAASPGQVAPSFAGWLRDLPVVGYSLQKDTAAAKGALAAEAAGIRRGLGNAEREAAGMGAHGDLVNWVKNVSEDEASLLYHPVEQALGNQRGNLGHTLDTLAELGGRSDRQYALPTGIVNQVNGQINRAILDTGEPAMTFAGMLALKKDLGNMLSGKITAEPGTNMEAVKALYGAVARDMEDLAGPVGTSTRNLYDTATREFTNDISVRRKLFASLVGKRGEATPAAVFDRILSMAGESKGTDSFGLLRVRQSVSEKTWNDIQSAIIARLGKEDALGEWSFQKFTKSWKQELSEDGKTALFSPEHKAALEDIAKVSAQYAKLDKYANTSRSAIVGATIGAMTAFLVAPLVIVKEIVGGVALSAYLAKSETAVALSQWGAAVQTYIKNPSATALSAVTKHGVAFKDALKAAGLPAEALEKAGILGATGQGIPGQELTGGSGPRYEDGDLREAR